jgi:hypothetical protein
MSSLASENQIFTEPSQAQLGVNTDRINIPRADFDVCFVNGVDIGTEVGSLAAHVAATTAHGVTGVVVGTTGAQTLTGKTLDSADNTVVVNGTNVNLLLAQDVRTTATPTFNNLALTSRPGNILTNVSPDIVTGKVFTSFDNGIIVGGTNIELLLSQDVRATATPTFNNLALTSRPGNLLTTGSVDVVTGKTVNSADNTLVVGGTNVNLLLGQDVRATATPTFNNLALTSRPGNILTTGSVDVVTGKTVNSADNTLVVGGTNVNLLLGQDVRATATPTFASISLGTIPALITPLNLYYTTSGVVPIVEGPWAVLPNIAYRVVRVGIVTIVSFDGHTAITINNTNITANTSSISGFVPTFVDMHFAVQLYVNTNEELGVAKIRFGGIELDIDRNFVGLPAGLVPVGVEYGFRSFTISFINNA